MAELDIAQSTTTDIASVQSDFSVSSQTLDGSQLPQDEVHWDYPNAARDLGYYKEIPELKSAIDTLALWTVGKGVMADRRNLSEIGLIRGWGKDTFQSIMEGMMVSKKALGDAFAEIIRDEKTQSLLNIKPLYTGDMRIVTDKKGLIKRYEQRVGVKDKPRTFETHEILHLVNNRFANEIHGTPVSESIKWIIDARNEALRDHRVVIHRNRIPVRIIEVDTENTAKRDALIREYEQAIKKGEVLVIPKGTVEIKDTTITIQDPISWIQYLENFFYQVVGTPKVIATSQGFTEAGAKVGYITFEPVYTREQTLLETDIFNQVGLTIKFNRPPSLHGMEQENEQKNTGQIGIQPNDTQVGVGRSE